tara:strand:+ start:259 stop:507 length:249 start_codon:yes stop_codon:yes gene_type:complete
MKNVVEMSLWKSAEGLEGVIIDPDSGFDAQEISLCGVKDHEDPALSVALAAAGFDLVEDLTDCSLGAESQCKGLVLIAPIPF